LEGGNKEEESHSKEEFAHFSRRQRQSFQHHQQKIKEEGYRLQVQWERAREISRHTQLLRTAG
jgi:hypothetical protein